LCNLTDSFHQVQASSKRPLVSWVLCADVLDEHLWEALASCFSQSFTNFECIVVANGDDAEEIEKSVKGWFGKDIRLRVFVTKIKYLTFSLSLGLHHARGDLIARMDGDDIALPDRLLRQVNFMMANPNVTVLGSDYEFIDAEGQCLNLVKMPKDDISIRKELLKANPFCHPSVMYRRQSVIDIGGYLGGTYAQDYDLWCRLALDPTVVFANLPTVCLRYRVSSGGRARRAQWAYASMAGAQFRNFVAGAGWAWLLASFMSATKVFIRADPSNKTGN
jgi:glycosyltransferase involved in cell wall biosynthesis